MSLIVAVCGGTGGALTGRAGADDPRGGDPTLVAGEVRTLGEPTSLVYAVAFKADASRIASVARGLRIVRVWDGVTGRSLIDFSEEEPNFNVGVAPAVAVAFGPAHAQIVTGGPRARIYDGGTRCWSGGAIRFWDMASKEKLHNLYDFETFIMGIAVGVDGRRVAAIDYHGTYRAWSTASWGEIDSVRFPSMIEGSSSTASTKISFSADACRAAAIADEPDRRRFRQLVLFDGPRRTARPIAEGYYCAAMSRRGEFVAAGIGPDRLSVLAFETGRTLLEASTESVGAIYFLGWSFAKSG